MSRTFQSYTLGAEMARGGQSILYEGSSPGISTKFVVKQLRSDFAEDPRYIHRFEKEAQSASRLYSHPNVVKILAFGREAGLYYIVMEYVDGSDLRALLRQVGKIPQEIALLLVDEVCYGLQEAHEQGIIHRDIKPGNILLSRTGELKIADFGLARDTVGIDGLDFTIRGDILGTPAYMSPEQAQGKRVDLRTDVFSLGALMYHILTGEKPFPGTSFTRVIRKILDEDPLPVREHSPAVSSEVAGIVQRELEKDPGNLEARKLLMEVEEACDKKAIRNIRELADSRASEVVANTDQTACQPNGDRLHPVQSTGSCLDGGRNRARRHRRRRAATLSFITMVVLADWFARAELTGNGVQQEATSTDKLATATGPPALAPIATEPRGEPPITESKPPPAEERTPAESEAAPPRTGKLHIESAPPGAILSLRNRDDASFQFLGGTPRTVILEGGNYRFLLEKEGYITGDHELSVYDGVSKSHTLVLAQTRTLSAMVRSRPATDLYVNDKLYQHDVIKVTLAKLPAADRITLELRHPDYPAKSWSRQRILCGEQDFSWDFMSAAPIAPPREIGP